MWLFTLFCISRVFGYNATSLGRAPLTTLNDGSEMPRIGIGTWVGFDSTEPVPSPTQYGVETTIDAGYRLIDTGSIYNTEKQVGLAINNKINEGIVNREDIFITTNEYKYIECFDSFLIVHLWNDAHLYDSVVPALNDSLSILNLDYVDLYLIHFPFALYTNFTIRDVDYLETWQGMIEAKKLGLARSIGISNFNITQMQRLIDNSEVIPAVLQVEVNLNLQQSAILEFCRTYNIKVIGYTPFGSIYRKAPTDAPPPRIDDENLVNIAKKYNKTVPQIVLRYLFELGVTPIPRSVNKEHVEHNIHIFDFELTQKEKDLLKSYDVNYRTHKFLDFKNSTLYPF